MLAATHPYAHWTLIQHGPKDWQLVNPARSDQTLYWYPDGRVGASYGTGELVPLGARLRGERGDSMAQTRRDRAEVALIKDIFRQALGLRRDYDRY